MFEATNPLGTLRSLHVAGFTVFENETFEFCDGLNVIVGENGTGKTHLLKLAYAATKALYPQKAGRALEPGGELQVALSRKLENVFLPDNLGRLCRRIGPISGPARVRIEYKRKIDSQILDFSFNENQSLVDVNDVFKQLPNHIDGGPIYLPPREVLSLVPEFIEDYRKTTIRFEETYFDLAMSLLGSLTVNRFLELQAVLETAMGGQLVQRTGRLYLKSKNGFEVEAPLMAEGVRKLATLAYLARNGSLACNGALFWDEPEANLNPRLMGALADALAQLVAGGVQVFVATHSLFFLREIALRVDKKKDPPPARYFSLVRNGDGLTVNRADKIDELDGVAVLDAAIEQDERLERLYWEQRK
jgi:hypothetical protein